MQLSHRVVSHAHGLPLALVTLASILVGRTINQWKSALTFVNNIPDKGLWGLLQLAFDGLEFRWKEIFLDIACFFCGKEKDQVIEILENCGFDARIGMGVLMDASLLVIRNNKLWMHDLVQDMGRSIVYQESPLEPGKRSRLWNFEDLRHVLLKNTVRTLRHYFILWTRLSTCINTILFKK